MAMISALVVTATSDERRRRALPSVAWLISLTDHKLPLAASWIGFGRSCVPPACRSRWMGQPLRKNRATPKVGVNEGAGGELPTPANVTCPGAAVRPTSVARFPPLVGKCSSKQPINRLPVSAVCLDQKLRPVHSHTRIQNELSRPR